MPTMRNFVLFHYAQRLPDGALAQAEFIDTATARVLGRAGEFLGHRGRQLTPRSPSRLAIRVLAVFGLCHLVEPSQPLGP